jgi:N6-adenosine-specific RNA methylase IME4
MSAVSKIELAQGGALTNFEPHKARMVIASIEGAIKQAKLIRDWAMGNEAIEALIAWQMAFVAWWDATTPERGHIGRGRKIDSAEARDLLTEAEKEHRTGISRRQVQRWRERLRDPEAYRLTLRKALQTVAMSRDPHVEPVGEGPELTRKYRCIVIDPPWPMQKIKRDVRPNQSGFDYPTMDAAQLEAFGKTINDVTAKDCHLFLWTTHKFLKLALLLIEHWGFRYGFAMVWRKSGGFQPYGLPQFNCEFVLYGRRGSPSFLETTGFFCCFDGVRREHSRKPDEFYDLIRRVTDGPRLDMFSRGPHDGFDQWGNQVAQFPTVIEEPRATAAIKQHIGKGED